MIGEQKEWVREMISRVRLDEGFGVHGSIGCQRRFDGVGPASFLVLILLWAHIMRLCTLRSVFVALLTTLGYTSLAKMKRVHYKGPRAICRW